MPALLPSLPSLLTLPPSLPPSLPLLTSHAIPPDVYRKRPLCMVQYDMYSKCRVPAEEVDITRQTSFSESRHVIIARNGHVSTVHTPNVTSQ